MFISTKLRLLFQAWFLLLFSYKDSSIRVSWVSTFDPDFHFQLRFILHNFNKLQRSLSYLSFIFDHISSNDSFKMITNKYNTLIQQYFQISVLKLYFMPKKCGTYLSFWRRFLHISCSQLDLRYKFKNKIFFYIFFSEYVPVNCRYFIFGLVQYIKRKMVDLVVFVVPWWMIAICCYETTLFRPRSQKPS